MATRELVLKLVSDASQFGRGFAQAERQASQSSKRIASVFGGTADQIDSRAKALDASFRNLAGSLGAFLAAGKVLQFAGDSVRAFGELEDSIGAVETVFGRASQTVLEFSEGAATAAGLSEAAFNQAATTIGNQLRNAGFSAEEAASKTIDLVQRAADAAALFGTTTEEALSAFGAALRGEFDPIERYTGGLNAAAVAAKAVELGLADSASEVSASAKTLATLELVFDRTATAAGRFAEEADGVQGSQKQLAAEIENLKADIGEELAPAVLELLTLTRDLAPELASIAGELGAIAAEVAPLIDLLGSTVGKVFEFRDTLDGLSDSNNRFVQGIGEVLDIFGLTKGAVGIFVEALDQLRDGLKNGGTVEKTADLSDEVAELNRQLGFAPDNLDDTAEELDNVGDAARTAGEEIKTFGERLLAAANPAFGAASAIDKLRDAQGKLEETLTDPEATLDDQAQAQLDYAQAVLEAQAALDAFSADGIETEVQAIAAALDIPRQRAVELLEQLGLIDGATFTATVVVNEDYRPETQRFENLRPESDPMAIVAGARAAGGPVDANRSYLVGEDGPELFTPMVAGRIDPNITLNGSGGGFNYAPTIVNPTTQDLNRSMDIQRTLLLASVGRMVEGS